MKILVVDDDSVVVESCRRIFEAAHMEAQLVSSAEAAMELLAIQQFDLMLADVFMPRYDGILLLDTVREKWPELPVIVMSGYATPGVMARVKQAGAIYFIAKPFNPDELIAAIRVIVEKHIVKEE